MTIQEFVPMMQALIEKDELDEAALDIAKYCSTPQASSDKVRFAYVHAEALHITGMLSKLNKDVRRGIIDHERQNIVRNQNRDALIELIRILKDPTYSPPGVSASKVGKTAKRVGVVVLFLYGIFAIVVLAAVGFVFKFIWDSGLHDVYKETRNPKEIVTAPQNCYLTTGFGVSLYKDPQNGSPTIGQLPEGKRYEVIEVRQVKWMTNAPYDYYFKVHDKEKNWSGWIKEKGSTLEIAPACYQE